MGVGGTSTAAPEALARRGAAQPERGYNKADGGVPATAFSRALRRSTFHLRGASGTRQLPGGSNSSSPAAPEALAGRGAGRSKATTH